MAHWELVKKYPEFEYVGSHEFNEQFVKWVVKRFFCKAGKLLDLGCGRGYTIKVFEKLGFECRGCDIEPLEEWVGKVDLETDKLPYHDNYFDYVFSKDVIEHFSNPSNMLLEAYRVLKPKGKILIITHNFPERWAIIPNAYTKRKLLKTMHASFQIYAKKMKHGKTKKLKVAPLSI